MKKEKMEDDEEKNKRKKERTELIRHQDTVIKYNQQSLIQI